MSQAMGTVHPRLYQQAVGPKQKEEGDLVVFPIDHTRRLDKANIAGERNLRRSVGTWKINLNLVTVTE